MKYKIDKLSKMAHGNLSSENPLKQKPSISNLELSEDESEEEEEEKDGKKKIYVAPKKQPMYYNGDVQSKADKVLSRAKSRAIGRN